MRKILLVLGVVLLLGGIVIGVGASAPGTFDGAPPVPLAFTNGAFLDGWDVQVHTRDMQQSSGAVPGFNAQHGADCTGPPATHATGNSIGGAVFQCANHVMTAIQDDGYGVVYLTPPQMVDFANGGTVSFDLSTEKLSTRDWWDITVSPFLDSQALPLLSELSQGVDLQNPNRNSIVITTDNGQGAPNLKIVRSGSVQSLGGSGQAASASIAGGTNQAATRQPFRLTMTPTHIRFERLGSATGAALVFVDQDVTSLNWTQGVVQFGHHSYNPTKDGAGSPGTWHWDNIAVSPAVDFTIGGFTSRWTQGGTITALVPAPAGSYLRFSAICRPVVNGLAATKMTDSDHPEHFSSYTVPVAAGAQSWSISFVADDWYMPGFGCLAKDYSIWNPGGTPSTPTQSPSPSPAPTSTGVPPTPSPSPSPATATATLSPTATATNTPPVPTATPRTYRCQVRNPNGSWTTVWTRAGGGTCP